MKSDLTLDVNPVLLALSTNTYFTSLLVKDVSVNKNGSSVAHLLKNNKTLTRVTLKGLDANLNWYDKFP